MSESQDKALIVVEKVSKSDKYFSSEWLPRIISQIDSLRDQCYVVFHVETGLRVSDVVGTEWVHIDWQGNRAYIFDHKKDDWRWIHYPDSVKQLLKMWRKEFEARKIDDKRVFPFTTKTANRIIQKAAKRAQHPLAHLVGSHWLRHTFIRLSRRAGRDMILVRQNTGDTTKTIMDWYEGMSSEDMRKEIRDKPLFNKED
jgi:integrase